MRSRRHVEEMGETGIDLAPMLDFVLNLLIFFIITTSFVREAGISVDRPKAMTAQHKDSGNILIAVAANGDIWMDRHQVDLREVRPTIERLHVERVALPDHVRAGRLRGSCQRIPIAVPHEAWRWDPIGLDQLVARRQHRNARPSNDGTRLMVSTTCL